MNLWILDKPFWFLRVLPWRFGDCRRRVAALFLYRYICGWRSDKFVPVEGEIR